MKNHSSNTTQRDVELVQTSVAKTFGKIKYCYFRNEESPNIAERLSIPENSIAIVHKGNVRAR